jgi:hypothetical protein
MLTTLNEFEIEAGRGEARATSCQRMGDAVAPRACDPAAPRDARRLARPNGEYRAISPALADPFDDPPIGRACSSAPDGRR